MRTESSFMDRWKGRIGQMEVYRGLEDRLAMPKFALTHPL